MRLHHTIYFSRVEKRRVRAVVPIRWPCAAVEVNPFAAVRVGRNLRVMVLRTLQVPKAAVKPAACGCSNTAVNVGVYQYLQTNRINRLKRALALSLLAVCSARLVELIHPSGDSS